VYYKRLFALDLDFLFGLEGFFDLGLDLAFDLDLLLRLEGFFDLGLDLAFDLDLLLRLEGFFDPGLDLAFDLRFGLLVLFVFTGDLCLELVLLKCDKCLWTYAMSRRILADNSGFLFLLYIANTFKRLMI